MALFNMILAASLGAALAGAAAPAQATEAKSAEAGMQHILMLGDSIAAGYGLPTPLSLPARLEAALRQAGRAVAVANGGVSGDTTAGGLARLDWMLADRPDAVIVELGANDALRGVDPATSYANLDQILTRLDALKIKVLIAGMKAPRNLGADYVREFDAIYPRLAERHHCLLYPFLLDGVAADPALNQGDGIHPSATGVEVIVKGMLPYVERMLDADRTLGG